MLKARDHYQVLIGALLCTLFFLFAAAGLIHAEDAPKYPCPDTQPCKILTLSAQEERVLTGQNGILDTAAQARNLDLGQTVVYFKQKIIAAPAGEVKKDELKPPAENKSGKAVDNPKP